MKQKRFDDDDVQFKVATNLFEQVQYDIFMGERIHFSQAMNVHILSLTNPEHSMDAASYVCLNVTLTNHGVYLIDDSNLSFNQEYDSHEGEVKLKGLPNHV